MDLLLFHQCSLQECFVPRCWRGGAGNCTPVSPSRGSDAVEAPKGTAWMEQRFPTGSAASGGFEMRI